MAVTGAGSSGSGRLRRGAVGVLALGGLLVAACGGGAGGPEVVPSIPIEDAKTPGQLHELLDSIKSRTDIEAALCRARVYVRLQSFERSASPTLLSLGDQADLDALAHGAHPPAQEEAAGRLAAHFTERAENPVLSRSSFPGPLGEPLRRIVLLSTALRFAELAGRQETSSALRKLACAQLEIARAPSVSPEAARIWRKWATEDEERAEALARDRGAADPSPEARQFAEADAARHLEEGTRAADRGTALKADRSDPGGVLRWYLLALAHFGVVRETSPELTPGQEHALAAQDIVVRSLSDILGR